MTAERLSISMTILVTNDDGVRAPGLSVLRKALEGLGEIWVVAPDREQSATSHALTLSDPLRIQRLGDRIFSVSGTPTDCVLLSVRGVRGFIEPYPKLVVAGINHGPNMGHDVTYSGTVAAAIEGSLLGLPSIAFSNTAWAPQHLEDSGAICRRLVTRALAHPLPPGILINVNIPDLPLERSHGMRVTHLGKRVYKDEIIANMDPRGRPYYWIGGEPPVWDPDEKSDFGATEDGYVSITPLLVDWTDFPALEQLRDWLEAEVAHPAGER
jgi:5'-nucleotidase